MLPYSNHCQLCRITFSLLSNFSVLEAQVGKLNNSFAFKQGLSFLGFCVLCLLCSPGLLCY